MKEPPTREEVLALIRWDGQAFYWLPRDGEPGFNSSHAGRRAGCVGDSGYRRIYLFGRMFAEHRLVWLVVTGEWPSHQIDHINRDRSDNRFENLRDVPNVTNARNRSTRVDSTTGLTGVHWHKRDRAWYARIKVDGVTHHLGTFASKEEARAARVNFARNHGFTDCIEIAA